MTVHNYITPEGEVRWVKDMPEYPQDYCVGYCDGDRKCGACSKKQEQYESALSKAKEESVPWEYPERIVNEIDWPYQLENDTFYSFEFNGEVKVIAFGCEVDECESVEKCKYPEMKKGHCIKVARLIPSVTEQKEITTYHNMKRCAYHDSFCTCSGTACENKLLKPVEQKNPTEDEIAEFIKTAFQLLVGYDKYKMMDFILDNKQFTITRK